MPDFKYRYALQEAGAAAGGTAGGAPSPGYAAWFDAAASIFTDAGGTVPATNDGDPILNWQSKGGGYGALACVVPATFNAPHLKTGVNGINSQPVVREVAASTEMLSDAAQTATIFETGILAAAQGTVFAVVQKSSGLGRIWADSAGSITARVLSGPLVRVVLNDGSTKQADKAMSYGNVIHTFHHETGTLYSGVNDTRTASMGSATAGDLVAGAGYLCLFATVGIPNYFDGDLAELIFYATAQSENARMTTERYLAIKYGIALPY